MSFCPRLLVNIKATLLLLLIIHSFTMLPEIYFKNQKLHDMCGASEKTANQPVM
jgi:hypothetical protein